MENHPFRQALKEIHSKEQEKERAKQTTRARSYSDSTDDEYPDD